MSLMEMALLQSSRYKAAVDNLDVNAIAQDFVDKCETRRATFGHCIKH
jgi:hypothetical protein